MRFPISSIFPPSNLFDCPNHFNRFHHFPYPVHLFQSFTVLSVVVHFLLSLPPTLSNYRWGFDQVLHCCNTRKQRNNRNMKSEYEARMEERRQYNAQFQEWQKNIARLGQKGQETEETWIREKVRAIGSIEAKIHKISLGHSLHLPSPSLFPLDSQTRPATVKSISKQSPRTSSAAGILGSSSWRWRPDSENPAPFLDSDIQVGRH